jgi:hypothetical protein
VREIFNHHWLVYSVSLRLAMLWRVWYTFVSQPRAVFLFLRGELPMLLVQGITDSSAKLLFNARGKMYALKVWREREGEIKNNQPLAHDKKHGDFVPQQHNIIDGNGVSTKIPTPPETPKTEESDFKNWKPSTVPDVSTGQHTFRQEIS